MFSVVTSESTEASLTSSLFSTAHASLPLITPRPSSEVKATGKVALWLHPWHGCPWDNVQSELCGNNFAYLHIFCTAGTRESFPCAVFYWLPPLSVPRVHRTASLCALAMHPPLPPPLPLSLQGGQSTRPKWPRTSGSGSLTRMPPQSSSMARPGMASSSRMKPTRARTSRCHAPMPPCLGNNPFKGPGSGTFSTKP